MKNQICLSMLLFLPLVSCSTKFTESQRQALSTVTVTPGVLADSSYHEPNGGDRAAAEAATMVGVSSGTGALGGAVGALIGESIAAVQDGMYDSENSHHYDRIQKNTPNPAPYVTKQLQQYLKKDSFFGSRLRSESPNQIRAEVLSHGLVRASKTSDAEILVMPQMNVKFSLSDASDKKLFETVASGAGYHHPISLYSDNPKKLTESFEKAAEAAVVSFMEKLAKKTEP